MEVGPLDGSWLCSKYALPSLKGSDNPNVIFVTSGDGERPDPDYLAYYTGTAGVIAMAKATDLVRLRRC